MPAGRSARQRAAAAILSVATAVAILGASVAPFLTPAWVGFEQGRAGSAALTGFDAATLQRVTNGILGALVFGGDFQQATARLMPVLNPREIAHMESVRGVFAGFAVLVALSVRSEERRVGKECRL